MSNKLELQYIFYSDGQLLGGEDQTHSLATNSVVERPFDLTQDSLASMIDYA